MNDDTATAEDIERIVTRKAATAPVWREYVLKMAEEYHRQNG